MGVPITFLDKYNPEQFEIVAFRKGNDGKDLVYSLSRTKDTDRKVGIEIAERATILQNTYTTTLLDQYLTERTFIGALQSEEFATAIPGMIKNAEGKIRNKITYARITIRKKNEN